jgi:hypothetical protein
MEAMTMSEKILAAAVTAALGLPGALAHAATNPQAADFVERPLTLEVDGVRIPAALTVPGTGQPVAAIVLIPGSLFIDVDGNLPFMNLYPRMNADLAQQLAAWGHAVLRFAKIGPGTGSEVIDPERIELHRHFVERVVVARAALRRLREELGDTARNVRVWAVAGHSEGAVVASLLAAEAPDVDAVISLSGPSVGLLGIMRDQASMFPGPDGKPADLSAFDEAAARIRRGEPLQPDAARQPQLAMLATLDPKALAYIREVDAVDPARSLAAVNRPVVIIQGGRDGGVPEKHAHRLAEARGTRPTTLKVFPELQHFYKRAEPDMDPQAAFSLATATDPRVAEAIDGWLRSLR